MSRLNIILFYFIPTLQPRQLANHDSPSAALEATAPGGRAGPALVYPVSHLRRGAG